MAANRIGNVGAQVDLELRQGADFSTTVSFKNPDGTAVDLTGCALAAQIRREPRSPAPPVAAFTLTITAPPTAGIATMAISAATTAAIPCGNTPDESASWYFWDLQLTDSTGKISSPLHGCVTILREVTR